MDNRTSSADLKAAFGAGVLSTGINVVAIGVNHTPLLYFAAAAGLIVGVAIVLALNVWTADWRVLITLLGWIGIADSARWLLLADAYVSFWAGILTSSAVAHAGGG